MIKILIIRVNNFLYNLIINILMDTTNNTNNN